MNKRNVKIPPKGIAILRYFTYPAFDKSNTIPTYEKFYGDTDLLRRKNTVVSKDVAMRLIEEMGLTKVVDNENGAIWE